MKTATSAQVSELTQGDVIRASRGLDPTQGRWPISRERVALDRIRHAARQALPRVIQVWISGLEDEDKWFRHRCAAELANRFGLPAMTEQRHQVDSTQIQVMVFPFANPYPAPPQAVEVVDVVDEVPDPGQPASP